MNDVDPESLGLVKSKSSDYARREAGTKMGRSTSVGQTDWGDDTSHEVETSRFKVTVKQEQIVMEAGMAKWKRRRRLRKCLS